MRARAVGKIFQSMLTDVSFALQETVNKYKLKINDGNKDVEENLEIDTEKQTEIYRIPKTDSRNGGEVDIVYDFKKVTNKGGVCLYFAIRIRITRKLLPLKLFSTRFKITKNQVNIIACVQCTLVLADSSVLENGAKGEGGLIT